MVDKLDISEVSKDFLRDWQKLQFSAGKLAPQADWSVVVRLGDTSLLITAVMDKYPEPDKDFLPLTIDFRETYYAAGKIGWNPYQKREWKPSEQAILVARLTDRPLRPLFPEWMVNDVVITITALSIDKQNPPGVPAIIGASLALMLAWIPFAWPVGAVRIGYKDWNFLINPSYEDIENGQLNMVVAWTKDSITMVETWASDLPPELIIQAFELAKKEIAKVCAWQEEFLSWFDIKQQEVVINKPSEALIAEITQVVENDLPNLFGKSKKEFWDLYEKLEEKLFEIFKDKLEDPENEIFSSTKLKMWFFKVVKNYIRQRIFQDKIRVDGRKPDEIRPLYAEVGLIPRVHWSWLFQRGETQVLSVATLWAPGDVQLLDTMEHDEEEKRFMHHYNMPPFSTGEARPTKAPSRREIGHWKLAEKALEPMIPSEEEFPYTIRVVSEVLSSNGSTSMASVCASTLALMDAGVPIKKPVSWIAMGLLTQEQNGNLDYIILSDIQGLEDFIGDMDFKVAGAEGITALQMDIKVSWLTLEIIQKAIEQAMKGKKEILDFMLEVISQPRAELSVYAPKLVKFKLSPSQIRDVIGPGGATINEIIKQTKVSIDFKDDGTTIVTAKNAQSADEAVRLIKQAAWQPSEWDVIEGKITRVEPYGVFVDLWKGKIWLVHVKNLWPWFIADPKVMFKEWDKIKVKVIKIEDDGKIQLRREM